jgi:hypothetical protein
MTKRKNPPKWPKLTGPLATPIKWTGPASPDPCEGTILGGKKPDEAKQREQAARYKEALAREFVECLEKLRLLKEHFAIPETDGTASWVILSITLAQYANIPGFRREYWWEGRGKNKHWEKNDFRNWTDGMCIALVRHVAEAKTKYGINTNSGALDSLLKEEPCLWNSGKKIINEESRKKKVESFVRRLGEAKRRIAKKNLHAFLDHETPILNAMYPRNPKEDEEHETVLNEFLSINFDK